MEEMLSLVLNSKEWWKKINVTTGSISFVVMEEDGVGKSLNNMKYGFCKVEFNVNAN